ncbi:unnamed protein product [Dovyalis caffra]|uniref:Uncharacterized protein n=1 Tax=Dovyalis caffra TaxID=77055 RepID=A0AAV1SBB6_9ROSI|nr:unnamed protein product [Dovyalis caffra]
MAGQLQLILLSSRLGSQWSSKNRKEIELIIPFLACFINYVHCPSQKGPSQKGLHEHDCTVIYESTIKYYTNWSLLADKTQANLTTNVTKDETKRKTSFSRILQFGIKAQNQLEKINDETMELIAVVQKVPSA